MKNLLFGFGMLLLTVTGTAQQVAKGLTASNGQFIGFLEYKPTNYNADPSIRYPLIIFLHGIGERGNGTTQISSVAANGIPKYINAGNPMRFYWNGKWETFLVLSPQLSSSYGDWQDFYVEEMIKYAKANLQIDTNRIILTGLSLGGGGTWHYSTSSLANAQKLAAIGAVCGTCSAVTPANIANANLPLWAFHALDDGVVGAGCTTSQVANVNAANPLIPPYMTLFSNGGHFIWDRAYDTLYNWQNPNIFEWFLAQNKSLPPDIFPVANAGSNVTVSTSPGVVNLSAAASYDPDGTILRYIWRKVSGPATGNIISPVSTTGLTQITNLNIAGTYVFEVKVVDDRANWKTATVTVTVTSGAVSNIPPVTQAGADQATITSTANLNGAMSYDPDGNISSYQWTKISGPVTYSISNANVANPALSFLMLGDYAFELRTTDNAGASTRDTVIVRSSAAVLPVTWLSFTARKEDHKNLLSWTTNGELNNSYFDVQRSDDGKLFYSIGKVNGSGTSLQQHQYSFADSKEVNGKSFYRLKQVSSDGSSSYSNVVSLAATLSKSAIDYYPNPVRDVVTVTFNNPQKGTVTMRLIGVDGRLQLQKQLLKEQDQLSVSLPMQTLNKGVYFLEVQIGEGTRETMKVVKQ